MGNDDAPYVENGVMGGSRLPAFRTNPQVAVMVDPWPVSLHFIDTRDGTKTSPWGKGSPSNPSSPDCAVENLYLPSKGPATVQFEKARKGHPLCLLGKDVTFDMVSALSKRTVIGKFEYLKPSRADILSWVRLKWKGVVNNIPRILQLSNGWLLFLFLSKEDRMVVESRYWILGMGSLVLDRWHTAFDPKKEVLNRRHLWVILSDFPLQC